jgi:hypothetical protein
MKVYGSEDKISEWYKGCTDIEYIREGRKRARRQNFKAIVAALDEMYLNKDLDESENIWEDY